MSIVLGLGGGYGVYSVECVRWVFLVGGGSRNWEESFFFDVGGGS